MSRTQPNQVDERPLADRLRAYGCTDFIRLDEALSRPEQLDYLDLLPKRGGATQPLPITAVAENQGTALLYILDACGDAQADAATLAKLQQQLANRSDPAWLGVVRPGSLEIYPIGFHEAAATAPIQTIVEQEASAPFFFQSLVHGTFSGNRHLRGSDYVFKEIFGLLTQTTDKFVPTKGKPILEPLDVLSMAGRALFFRFLIDRAIVLNHECEDICSATTDLKDAFSSAKKAAQTSAWLDETFNGDFMRLIDESIPADNRRAREKAYLAFFQDAHQRTDGEIFLHLQAILRGWQAVGGAFQPELDWGDLNFAHIPVGVLSQVYESFSHRADSYTARKTSVHYTPRSIAGLMVEQSFAAVKHPATAHLLDSSCGAGIFLVLAFRRLVHERWQQDKERPRTRAIQSILYNQLRGFDVSESALRLAALALYITAIEVNGTQRPPKDLKFPKNLRDEVLFHFGDDALSETKPSKTSLFPLGSLGPKVPTRFNKSFDIVIGNPPWTRLREDEPERNEEDDEKSKRQSESTTDELNKDFTAIGRRVLEARGFADLAKRYQNPDKNPDLPFLWRATEWAKDGGIIALAMPARLFGRTSGKGFEAWRAVLRSIEVTGLINGADLRWSSVWKDVKMPFCVFFARNAVPSADHRFYYSSPISERALNDLGRFRIDYESTQPISTARIEKQPWVLKTLSLGTWLDVEVMEALTDPSLKTLADFWAAWDPTGDKTGQGYNRSPKRKQTFVDFLGDLQVFEPPEDGFSINFESFQTYAERYGKNRRGESSAHMPRREELFAPPLVIIPKAPGDDPFSPKAYVSSRILAFSQSYYGYSCAGHREADTLAAFIYLLAHSTLFRYFALMTSVSQGADHMIFTKQDFDSLPFPDVTKVSARDKTAIRNLANQLQHDAAKPWQELDALLFRLFGLDDDAVKVAKDTLFAAASYRKAGREALKRTVRETRADFITELQESLEPYFDVCGEHAVVREASFQPDNWNEPWFFLAVSREADTVPIHPSLIRNALKIANERGTSRIIVKAPGRHGLLLGLLNQRRWWTKTRARLCSQHIIRECLSAFGLPEHA